MHAIRVRVAAAVAVAALTTGGIMATATVVGAAPPPKVHPTKVHPTKLHSTKLSIRNKVVAHGKHHVDTVTGVLTSARTGLAGETVALEARMGITPRWKVVATGPTGTGGTITFTVTPKVKTQFKYVFAGQGSYRASHSNVITLSPVK